MDGKHRGIEMLGWLSVIAGYGLALGLIRSIFLRSMRGFGIGVSKPFWIVLGYLLFSALAFYLYHLGRRAISIARGSPQLEGRFGWGRMLLGAILLYSSAVSHFHLLPTRHIKHLDPANEAEALGMNITAVVIALGCILLVYSGIWRGFRRQRTKPSG
jgi:hypothetical protein